MIRPSALNTPCGLAPVLNERYPERSPAADRGDAIHREIAACINNGAEPQSPEARALFAAWRPFVSSTGAWSAEAEVKLVLRDPETDELITEGTADFVGVDGRAGRVIDWKTGSPEYVAPAAENLQLHAYALAVALAHGCTEVEVALAFLSPEGVTWDRHVLREDDLAGTLERVRVAASRPPVANPGPHCVSCWQRKHCPSWMLPAHDGDGALVPLTRPGGLTMQNAPRAYQAVQAIKRAVEVAEARLKDLIREEGPIPMGDKVLTLVDCEGRCTADVEGLKAAGLTEYLRRGNSYTKFTLRKAR